MQVLVLAWDAAGVGRGGQAAGLAGALLAAGHDVRVVTRAGGELGLPAVAGLEVHAVADAPPIVPAALADAALDALAFANRATSVAVRRLEETPVDVVHAEGWQTGPVVAALRHSHDVPVVAAVEPWELATADPAVADVASALAAVADVVVQRATRRTADGVRHLPPGVQAADRRPGPPPARGPLVLVAPPGVSHMALAGRVRTALATPRRISRSWRRRPFAVAVLDPRDLDSVVRAMALGVPVVTVPGPTGDLVAASGAGAVLPTVDVDASASTSPDAAGDAAALVPAARQVAGAVDRLVAARSRAVALGAAASRAAAAHTWSGVADAWTAAADEAVRRPGRPRLHAAG